MARRAGLIPRAVESLWATLREKGITSFAVTVSMVDIFNEVCPPSRGAVSVLLTMSAAL
jgi:hypothetical protein